MPHFNFMDIVNSVASENWGSDLGTIEEASKRLIDQPETLGAFASIELLKRLNAVSKAVGRYEPPRDRSIKIRSDHQTWPTKVVGDKLYSYSADEEGLVEYIIIAKDARGYCLVVALGDFDLEYPPVVCLSSDLFATIEEAMLNDADYDIKHYTPRAEYAAKLRAAVEGGKPLDEFMNGNGFE